MSATTQENRSVHMENVTTSLAGLTSYLAETSSEAELGNRLLEVLANKLRPLVCRIDFAESRMSELAHDETAISPELAGRISQSFLEPLAKRILADELSETTLSRRTRGDEHLTLITSPMVYAGKLLGALTVMTSVHDGPTVNILMTRLDAISAIASAVIGHRTERTRFPDSQEVRAVAETAHFTSPTEFAYSLANQLCAQLQAEVVSVGIECNDRMKVLAISGVPEIKKATPGTTAFTQLLEECLDHNRVVIAQAAKLDDMDTLPIHRQHSAERQNASVCSIPIHHNETVAGAITIQRDADQPFQQEQIQQLAKMLGPYGNALRVLERADRSSIRHALDATKGLLSKNLRGWRICLLAAATCLAAWFCLGTLTYRPLCATKVVAADLRHFSAPFGAKLLRVNVAPGEFVEAGTVLAEFETVDLRLQLTTLIREMRAKKVEMYQGLAEKDLSAASLHQSELKVLESRIDAVQRQIEDARLIAPVAGTVVLSDLQRRVGQAFQEGDEILQLAPEGAWLVEIEIPDDIIAYIQPEQPGKFSAIAQPTLKQKFHIEHIDGVAQVIEDRNVFVARAELKEKPMWMRSGMEGTSQIESVPRPVWWVALHGAVDWARSNFWM